MINYFGAKIKVLKNKDSKGYEAFIFFDGELKASQRVTAKLRRDAVYSAEGHIEGQRRDEFRRINDRLSDLRKYGTNDANKCYYAITSELEGKLNVLKENFNRLNVWWC